MEEEKPKKKWFNIKVTKWDVLGIAVLLIFLILTAIPTWFPSEECEVARAGYKCDTLEEVMKENCVYWGSFDCDSSADVSLTQIEWYIDNLCDLQNRYHNTGLDCSSLRGACNQIVGENVCPFGV